MPGSYNHFPSEDFAGDSPATLLGKDRFSKELMRFSEVLAQRAYRRYRNLQGRVENLPGIEDLASEAVVRVLKTLKSPKTPQEPRADWGGWIRNQMEWSLRDSLKVWVNRAEKQSFVNDPPGGLDPEGRDFDRVLESGTGAFGQRFPGPEEILLEKERQAWLDQQVRRLRGQEQLVFRSWERGEKPRDLTRKSGGLEESQVYYQKRKLIQQFRDSARAAGW